MGKDIAENIRGVEGHSSFSKDKVCKNLPVTHEAGAALPSGLKGGVVLPCL